MSTFSNSKKNNFLNSIPQKSLDSYDDDITARCKFNFSYFDSSQQAGQKFEDWTQDQLSKLLNKLKEYSKYSLKHWQNQKIGSGKHRKNILEIYGNFPRKSDFSFPPHVPHQVSWARFRLEQAVRLIGFVIPDSYLKKEHTKTGLPFDCNTFYIVFLDKYHRFFLTKK